MSFVDKKKSATCQTSPPQLQKTHLHFYSYNIHFRNFVSSLYSNSKKTEHIRITVSIRTCRVLFLRTRIRFKTLTTNDLRVQEPPPALWFTTANHTETPRKTCWNNEGGKIPYGNNQMRNKMITCFRALPSANYQIDVIARENEWIVEVLIAKAASSVCTLY